MFGIGFTEILIIGVILIVAVGPERMPGLLKAVVRGYREFRKATRELRASTGIDEILEDEDLKSLRNPLYTPPAAKGAIPAKPGAKSRFLTTSERADEQPPDGVDLAEIKARERIPDQEAEQRRGAKMALLAKEEEIVAAKRAYAEKHTDGQTAEETDEERAIREKIVALEEERVRLKTANAQPEDPEQHEQIVRAKLAAAGAEIPAELDPEEEQRRRDAKRIAAGQAIETAEERARREAKIAAKNVAKPETEEQRARREAKIARRPDGE